MSKTAYLTVTRLNLDDDPSQIIPNAANQFEVGDSRYNVNIRTFPTSNGKGGIVKSVPGNSPVEYSLPPGRNKVIGGGAISAKDRDITGSSIQSLIVFVWNSFGNHLVLQYFPQDLPNGKLERLRIDSALNFAEDAAIHSVAFQNNTITWCDGSTTRDNEPKRLDVVKANDTAKKEEWNIYMTKPTIPSAISSRTINIQYIEDGTPFYTFPYVVPAPDCRTVEATCKYIATFINSDPVLMLKFKAEACSKHIELTSRNTSLYSFVMNGTDFYPSSPVPIVSMSVVPQVQNKYTGFDTDKFTDTFIRPYGLIKPSCTYERNIAVSTNSVARRVFQFALRYLYFDGTISVIGIPSNVPMPPANCAASIENYNYIKINFTDGRLSNSDYLCILKSVQVVMRQVDPTLPTGTWGKWRVVETLEQEDFVLNQSYDFYNDTQYSSIADADQNSPFDYAPLRAETLTGFTVNSAYRIALAGNIEGYESPCPDLSVRVDISDVDPLSQGTFKVKYRWRFYCPLDPSAGSQYHQLIHDYGFGTCYGGISSKDYAFDSREDRVATDYDQRLGEFGPVIYSAGRYVFSIAKQRFLPAEVSGHPITPTLLSDGVADTSKNGWTVNPWNYTKRCAARLFMDKGAFVIEGEISLPIGTHILRACSNWCSRGNKLNKDGPYDLNSTGLDWQGTSMPIFMFGSIFGEQHGTQEITVTGNAGDVIDIGYIVGADLTNPNASLDSLVLGPLGISRPKVFQGYMMDDGGTGDIDNIQSGTRLERQVIQVFNKLSVSGTFQSFATSGTRPQATRWASPVTGAYQNNLPMLVAKYDNGHCVTDHNGFLFFASMGYNVAAYDLYAAAIGVTSDPANPAFTVDYTGSTLSSVNFVATPGAVYMNNGDQLYHGDLGGALTPVSGDIGAPNGQLTKAILYNHNTGAVDLIEKTSTKLKGFVKTADGNGVSGVLVLFENTSRTSITGNAGEYSITIFADASENANNRGFFRNQNYARFTRDRVVFGNISTCTILFTPNDFLELSPPRVDPPPYLSQFESGQPYSLNVPYELSDKIALVIPVSGVITDARGAKYKIGIVLFDGAGRMTSVGTNDSLEINIPHRTENLNNYDPLTYPTEEYRRGNASIEVTITNPNVPIPEYGRFTHYQIFVTVDTGQTTLLEWAANDVAFVTNINNTTGEPAEATYGSGLANETCISIHNMLRYKEINSDSLIGYEPTPGDRLIIYTDKDGQWIANASKIWDFAIKGGRAVKIGGTVSGTMQYCLIIEFDGNCPEIGPGTMFKVYRPSGAENETYYGTGPLTPINDPYGLTPTYSTLVIPINGIDTYGRFRDIPVQPSSSSIAPSFVRFFVHDRSMSDFYASRVWAQGKLNTYLPNAKQTDAFYRIRFTEPYIAGTDLNGTATVKFDAFADHQLEWGRIVKLIMIGGVMNVAALFKLVSRRPGYSVSTTGGNTTLSLSDRVLGDLDPNLASDYGCMNGESIASNGTSMLGLDLNRGVIFRKNYNGTIAISVLYKVNKYITQKCREYKSALAANNGKRIPIWGAFDDRNSEYVLCFPSYTSAPGGSMARTSPDTIEGETFSFFDAERSQGRDAFMTWYNYIPDALLSIGLDLVSFDRGSTWLHGLNSPNCNFYNVQYRPIITPVVTEEALDNKVFLSIGIVGSKWRIPIITNEVGQESELDFEDFRQTEYDWFAAFLRDKNTPDKLHPLINGDAMRSKTLELRMEGEDNPATTSELRLITVKYKPSFPLNSQR